MFDVLAPRQKLGNGNYKKEDGSLRYVNEDGWSEKILERNLKKFGWFNPKSIFFIRKSGF